MTDSLPTLAQVIGQNVRKLRADHTLEELAAYGKKFGASWSATSIRSIECGNFRPTIEAIAILALVLDRLKGSPTMGGTITSRDLFYSDQPIALGKGDLATSTDHLLEFLGGGTSGTVLDTSRAVENMPKKIREWSSKMEGLNLPDQSIEHYQRVEKASPETPAEKRLADKNQIDVYELRSWAVYLWGKSFEDHRDDIAGTNVTPQKKGRISRELMEELITAMKGKSSGDD